MDLLQKNDMYYKANFHNLLLQMQLMVNNKIEITLRILPPCYKSHAISITFYFLLQQFSAICFPLAVAKLI